MRRGYSSISVSDRGGDLSGTWCSWTTGWGEFRKLPQEVQRAEGASGYVGLVFYELGNWIRIWVQNAMTNAGRVGFWNTQPAFKTPAFQRILRIPSCGSQSDRPSSGASVHCLFPTLTVALAGFGSSLRISPVCSGWATWATPLPVFQLSPGRAQGSLG